MAQDRFSLSKNDRRLIQETIRAVKAGKGSQRPVPTRRRNRGGGGSGNIIICTATELIDADSLALSEGGVGEVALGVDDDLTLLEKIDVTNVTGKPIFAGSLCAVWGRKYIVNSNAAEILTGVWNGVGDKDNIESWALEVGGKKVFTGDGLIDSRWNIFDPHAMLDDIDDESIVTFGVGASDEIAPGDVGFKFNSLFVIATNVGTGGGGGDPWTGWPGPDPATGVAPGIVFLAHVAETDPVAGTDGDFEFDDTTPIVGTAPASGTALNSAARSFLPGEQTLVFGDATPTYHAFKVSENIARAAVNEATGVKFSDTEFDLDTFDAIIGLAPTSGKCTNIPAAQYSDDQIIKVIFGDDAKWQPLETYQTALFETTSTITARSGSYTWGTGTGKLLAKTGAGTHSETGATAGITLYNSSLDSIAIDRIVQCKKIDGQWFIDVDDCS